LGADCPSKAIGWAVLSAILKQENIAAGRRFDGNRRALALFASREVPEQTRRCEMQSIIRLPLATIAAAGLLLAGVAHGQNQSQPASPSTTPAPTVDSSNIPDKKLDAAAAAAKDVSAIRLNYERKVAEAPAAEKERLAGEADSAMTKAVTDKGLSVEEYMAIIKVAQNDAEVRGKLLQRLKN
jgi:hypothetical protein